VRRLAAILGVLVSLPLAGTAGGATGFRDTGPVFSPDGSTIAFMRVPQNGGTASIMLVGADGRKLRSLVGVWAGGLAWSPDGRWLAYAAAGDIWRIDVSTGAIDRVTTGAEGAWQPSWSPDGSLIAYTRFERCYRCTGIWVINADGTGQHEISLSGRRPDFSPDGTKIALSLNDPQVVDLDGQPVVHGAGAYVSWSPHGRFIAYTGGGLWIRNIETGVTRRISKYLGQKPAWSPDGKVIAGGAGLSQSLALVRAKDGSHFKKLEGSNIDAGVPSWSPQGLVAYTQAHGCGIDVAREDGSHVRRLTRPC
jgi:Tol biopolymer transport system component